MTASEIKARLLRVVGVDSPVTIPAHILDAVVNAINHAYQVLWQDVPRERRSYARRTDTVVFGIGENLVALDTDVQTVLPPVRALPARLPLLVATHRAEVEMYGLLRGTSEGAAGSGPPEIYHVDTAWQSGADSMLVSLLVAPTPTVETSLLVEVEREPPRVIAADFCTDPSPALGIPHDYAESLLLPIAAYHFATQSHWFNKPERLPGIEAEYERAKGRAGIVDPTPRAAASTVKPADR